MSRQDSPTRFHAASLVDPSPGPRRGRTARLLRAAAGVIGWSLLAAVVVILAAVADGGERNVPIVALAALAAWTAPMASASLALLALARHRRSAATALAVLLLVVAWLRPFPAGGSAPSGATVEVTVMSQNLLLGRADAVQVVDAVRRQRPDALVLTELSERAVDALRAAGLSSELKYSFLQPRGGAAGTGIWSATPLTETGVISGMRFAALDASTVIGGRPVRLLGVHAVPPQQPEWATDLALLRRHVTAPLLVGQPLVIAGDFNATQYNGPMHRLLDAGLTDAGQAELWSWQQQTWPVEDAPSMPASIRIDHVLVPRSAAVEQVHTVQVAGTDHLGLVARVRLAVPD
jgi:endonuclease/exonuclease/phosphatase (EEP) superfamily protein YafD